MDLPLSPPTHLRQHNKPQQPNSQVNIIFHFLFTNSTSDSSNPSNPTPTVEASLHFTISIMSASRTVRTFAVSHTAGRSVAAGSIGAPPAGDPSMPLNSDYSDGDTVPRRGAAPTASSFGGENALVADSIRMELRRLRSLERELEEGIAAEGGGADDSAGLAMPDTFPAYVSPTRASPRRVGPRQPPLSGQPAIPIAGQDAPRNAYLVDLALSGKLVAASDAHSDNNNSINTNTKLNNSTAGANTSASSRRGPHTASAAVAVAAADPSAVYLDHYQRRYDDVMARRRAAEAAGHQSADAFAGGVVAAAAVEQCGGSAEAVAALVGGRAVAGGLVELDAVDPLSVIKPFTLAAPADGLTPSDVESGVGEVRSSILEMKTRREHEGLLAALEARARIGRTTADDAAEAQRRDVEASVAIRRIAEAQRHAGLIAAAPNEQQQQQQQLLITSSSGGGIVSSGAAPYVPASHATLPPLYAGHAASTASSAGGALSSDPLAVGGAADRNQHGFFVHHNTERQQLAAASAATEAAYELEQIPFAESRIGKEFAARRRRVYSAHVAAERDTEVAARRHYLKGSTASITFGQPMDGGDANNEDPERRPATAGAVVAVAAGPHNHGATVGAALAAADNAAKSSTTAVSIATSTLPPLISTFAVSRHVPSALPRSSHSAVIGGAFASILARAEAGRPIADVDDLPEEPRVLVQLSSVVPIAGRTAFTVPLTLATPLRMLQRAVMALAGLDIPSNSSIADGDRHARTATAAWPESDTYKRAVAGAHDSAIFRGHISANDVPSSPADASVPPPSRPLPSVNNNYAYNTHTADITAPSPTGCAIGSSPLTSSAGVAVGGGGAASVLRHRPLTRPNTALHPTAPGGVTLYAAGADAPLDLDKSFLELGYRFPPLVTVRGFRQEYYLTTAGSDRRVPCVWRPHMTVTDVAKDIGKRLSPSNFRHVRASIANAPPHALCRTTAMAASGANANASGGDVNGCQRAGTRAYLPLAQSIRFQTPDRIEGDPFLWELGLGQGLDGGSPSSSFNAPPPRTCAVQFMRSVNGVPYLAASSQVSTAMRLSDYCREAARACQSQLDDEKAAALAARSAAAEVGRRRRPDSASTKATSGQGQAEEGGAGAGVFSEDTTQFDDEDELVSPDGLYAVYWHRDVWASTGVPTLSYNPTAANCAERDFAYFITSDEDYTIPHASDCGVVPGAEVFVEFFDSYRKVWSGDELPVGASALSGGGHGEEGVKDGGESGGGVLGRGAGVGDTIVSATISRGAPATALTSAAKPSASSKVTATSSYPISAAEAQHGRVAIGIPRRLPSDGADVLTITTAGAAAATTTGTAAAGQRLRMLVSPSITTIADVLAFVWAQCGAPPMETYLWADSGRRLAFHEETLAAAGVAGGGTLHARRRPRLWLGEALAPPAVDRTMSYTQLPDAELFL